MHYGLLHYFHNCVTVSTLQVVVISSFSEESARLFFCPPKLKSRSLALHPSTQSTRAGDPGLLGSDDVNTTDTPIVKML